MILDHLIRLENIRSDLASPGDLTLFPVLAIKFRPLFIGFKLVDLGLKKPKGQFRIATLAALGLAGHDDSRRDVT